MVVVVVAGARARACTHAGRRQTGAGAGIRRSSTEARAGAHSQQARMHGTRDWPIHADVTCTCACMHACGRQAGAAHATHRTAQRVCAWPAGGPACRRRLAHPCRPPVAAGLPMRRPHDIIIRRPRPRQSPPLLAPRVDAPPRSRSLDLDITALARFSSQLHLAIRPTAHSFRRPRPPSSALRAQRSPCLCALTWLLDPVKATPAPSASRHTIAAARHHGRPRRPLCRPDRRLR